MKPRFVLNFLTAGRKKDSAGFALPLVIMGGLVITVAAAAIVMKGMNDQNQVTAQAAKSTADQAAEAGLTQVQAFLLKNPVLAKKHFSQWGSTASGSFVPNDAFLTEAAAELQGASCNYKNMTVDAVKAALVTEITAFYDQTMSAPKALPNPSGNGAKAPKFQMVDYRFDASQQKGVVHVRGLAGEDNSPNQAKTNLVASFPITDGSAPFTGVVPGLWVKGTITAGQNVNNPGSVNAQVIYECDKPTFTTSAGNGQNSGYTEYVSGSQRIALPNSMDPPGASPIPMPDPPTSAPAGVTPASLPTVTGNLTLPRSGTDTTSSSNYNSANQTYYYTINSTSGKSVSGNGVNLQFTPGQKVVLFLTGNVDIGGNSQIVHDCSGVSGCDATDVQIIGPIANASGTFSTGGNSAVCSIFFWGPTYTLNLSGGGNAGNCSSGANQNGIYWAKSWTGGGQGSHNALHQTGTTWEVINPIANFKVKNRLGANSDWKTIDEQGAQSLMSSIQVPN